MSSRTISDQLAAEETVTVISAGATAVISGAWDYLTVGPGVTVNDGHRLRQKVSKSAPPAGALTTRRRI